MVRVRVYCFIIGIVYIWTEIGLGLFAVDISKRFLILDLRHSACSSSDLVLVEALPKATLSDPTEAL